MNKKVLLDALKKMILESDVEKDGLYKIADEYLDIIISKKEHKIMLASEMLEKIDFSNFNFKDIDISYIDFSKLHNVYINPQEVYKKNFYGCKLMGVNFTKEFYGCNTSFCDFTGSNNAIINPQLMYNPFSLYSSKTNSVRFTGSFDDVYVSKVDFTGSTGACINPDTVLDKNFEDTVLTDVKLLGEFTEENNIDGCYYIDNNGIKKMILR